MGARRRIPSDRRIEEVALPIVGVHRGRGWQAELEPKLSGGLRPMRLPSFGDERPLDMNWLFKVDVGRLLSRATGVLPEEVLEEHAVALALVSKDTLPRRHVFHPSFVNSE